MNETYYTIEQIAEKLQVHTMTIRRALQAGTLKGLKIGKEWRITDTQFNQFIQDAQEKTDRDKKLQKAS